MFSGFKNLVMNASRSKKLEHFYSLCGKESPVLDVGVSNNEHNSSVNLFLKNFRLDPHQYTGLAVEPMDSIRQKYHGMKFVEYPGGCFPFEDNEFDWVFSNAVIEHVGNEEQQLLFVNEMLRVGKNVFYTTPNKYFPVESHTNVFFRHWFDSHFYCWCAQNSTYWTKDNLILLGKKNLLDIMKNSNAKEFSIKSNRMLGWPMTFTVVCSS